jgi:hypothetical protein
MKSPVKLAIIAIGIALAIIAIGIFVALSVHTDPALAGWGRGG